MQKGPCQPKNHEFPQRQCESNKQKFQATWFNEYSNWLEYNIEKDAAYDLYCYLFKSEHGNQGGGDPFIIEGFTKEEQKKDSMYMLEAIIACITYAYDNV